MSKQSVPVSFRGCCTCVHWSGPIEDNYGFLSIPDWFTEGVCNGQLKYLRQSANSICTGYEKRFPY